MSDRVTAAIAFARENFLNDGAEGETVHLLCDELERLRALTAPTPGGKVDSGEHPAAAFVREVREEAGLDVALADEPPRLLFGEPAPGAPFASWIALLRGTAGGLPKPCDLDGFIDDARWCDRANVPVDGLSQLKSKEAVMAWLRGEAAPAATARLTHEEAEKALAALSPTAVRHLGKPREWLAAYEASGYRDETRDRTAAILRAHVAWLDAAGKTGDDTVATVYEQDAERERALVRLAFARLNRAVTSGPVGAPLMLRSEDASAILTAVVVGGLWTPAEGPEVTDEPPTETERAMVEQWARAFVEQAFGEAWDEYPVGRREHFIAAMLPLVREARAAVARLHRSEAACVREALDQVGALKAEIEAMRAGKAPLTEEEARAYEDIQAERARQIAKGRTPDRDDERSAGDWYRCLRAVMAKDYGGRRIAWVKVGSVAVAAIQSIDRLAASRGDIPAEVRPVPLDMLTPAEASDIIAGAPGQIGPGQTPIGGAPASDLAPGVRVRTAERLKDIFWSVLATAAQRRRASAEGVVTKECMSGGWWVRHPDGTEAPYDASELTPLPNATLAHGARARTSILRDVRLPEVYTANLRRRRDGAEATVLHAHDTGDLWWVCQPDGITVYHRDELAPIGETK